MAEIKHIKHTDSDHVVQLDSYLISSSWREGISYRGKKAPFEVRTAVVGNGAKIKVKGKSDNGKNLGTISSTITNNTFIGEFDIPDNADIGDKIYFDVELTGNNLNGNSNKIVVAAPPVVSEIKWSANEARRGDILKLTAKIENVPDGMEVQLTILEADTNGAHDKISQIPAVVKGEKIELSWLYEYHEDTDEIPTKQELKKYGGNYNPPEYFFVININGIEYGKDKESGLLTFKDWIEVEVRNEMNVLVTNKDFEITLADGSKQSGRLNGEGKAIIRDVPPGHYTIMIPDL